MLKFNGITEDEIVSVVKKAVKLAWMTVTLVPPALVSYPKEYDEDWMDKRITAWSKDEPSCPIIYFQPVLFYSALGQVGLKGIVGNKINQKTVECMLLAFLHDNTLYN